MVGKYDRIVHFTTFVWYKVNVNIYKIVCLKPGLLSLLSTSTQITKNKIFEKKKIYNINTLYFLK